jgi:hypothetical protein
MIKYELLHKSELFLGHCFFALGKLLDFIQIFAFCRFCLGQELSIFEEQTSDSLKIILSDQLVLPFEQAQQIAAAGKTFSRPLVHQNLHKTPFTGKPLITFTIFAVSTTSPSFTCGLK